MVTLPGRGERRRMAGPSVTCVPRRRTQVPTMAEMGEMDMPVLGADILRAVGNEEDPNWRDVRPRDVPKYLRERHWIRQWSGDRWPRGGSIAMHWKKELRAADLGRALDDPGDAFFELALTSRRFDAVITARTWVEVTEVFLPGQAANVNRFVREYNGLRGKGAIDGTAFLRSLDLGRPGTRVQRKMADEVVSRVVRKARKGDARGSYRALVDGYGGGVLIVGLPLWFAAWPATLEQPETLVEEFVPRVLLGFQAIERSVLRQPWCPFDSVVVIWNPTLESVDAWARAADRSLYSDPANVTWRSPVSLLKGASLLELAESASFNLRWDRYRSVDAAVADQTRRIRLGAGRRPFGPEAQLTVVATDAGNNRKWWFRPGMWVIQLALFLWLNGRAGLRRWLMSRVSPGRCLERIRLRRKLKRLYEGELGRGR